MQFSVTFTYFVDVAQVRIEESDGMAARHESLFNIAQLEAIQVQHVFFIFLL